MIRTSASELAKLASSWDVAYVVNFDDIFAYGLASTENYFEIVEARADVYHAREFPPARRVEREGFTSYATTSVFMSEKPFIIARVVEQYQYNELVDRYTAEIKYSARRR